MFYWCCKQAKTFRQKITTAIIKCILFFLSEYWWPWDLFNLYACVLNDWWYFNAYKESSWQCKSLAVIYTTLILIKESKALLFFIFFRHFFDLYYSLENSVFLVSASLTTCSGKSSVNWKPSNKDNSANYDSECSCLLT